MKFPKSLFVLGILNILAGLLYLAVCTLVIYIFIDAQKCSVSMAIGAYSAVITSIFLIVSGIAWLRKSKHSYVFLYLLTILICANHSFILYSLIRDEKPFRTEDYILTSAMNVYPAVLLFFTLFPPVIRWAKSFGKGSGALFKTSILIPYLVICTIGPAAVFAIDRIGTLSPVEAYEQRASGQLPDYPARNVSDNNDQTWWTPYIKSGVDEWVRLDMANPDNEISGISILGGSHYPDYPKEGNLYPLNSRPKRITVELSDGKMYGFDMLDKDEPQTFSYPAAKTKWVKVTIRSTYKGKKWDNLCISEIKVLARHLPFRK
jgi:hypothetical protein